MRYVLIGGSFEYRHTWYLDRDSPFNTMMRAKGFSLGPPFKWNGGIVPLDWESAADALECCIRLLAYEDRNIIAYSNGGEVALFLAATGFPVRTLTTVGTPVRNDVPVAAAEASITYHQHIYDEKDPTKILGQWDWPPFLKRTFPHARNYNLHDIGHGKVFFEEQYIRYWEQQGWLAAIKYLAAPAEVFGREDAKA